MDRATRHGTGTKTRRFREEEEPINRRQLTKVQRHDIYEKMRGYCAYCGCELDYERMTVDHIKSLASGGLDEMDNMLPACRSCNHYKGTSTLVNFRRNVEKFPTTLQHNSVTYRNAVRFGLVNPNPHKVTFYFEREGCFK